MIGLRDVLEYATMVDDEKEQVVIKRLQRKMETMLGYRVDKVLFESEKDHASNK